MTLRKIVAFALASLIVLVGAGLQNPAHAGSATYEILFDTSGLGQGAGGLLDMSLGVAFPPGSPSVTVDSFNPSTDGTISPGFSASDPPLGTTAGDLTTPGGVTQNNTASSSTGGQDFAVKSFFDVFVEISGPEVGSGAVGPWSGSVFTFTIFDSGTGSESATFTVNPNVGPNGEPIVDGTIGIMPSGPQVQIIPAGQIPEPTSVVLLGLGIGAAAVVARMRKRRAA